MPTPSVVAADPGPLDEHHRQRGIDLVVESLHGRLGGAVDVATIRDAVEAEFATFAHAKVREFVPVLVEARVRSRLMGRQPGAGRVRDAAVPPLAAARTNVVCGPRRTLAPSW